MLVGTLALAHPIIPFVTEEIYGFIPGAEGLLAAGIQLERASVDDGAERAVGRVIEAVQAMRAWRDLVRGAGRRDRPRAARSAPGYEDTGEHLARLARLSFSSDGGDPVASVPVPGGVVEILPSAEVDTGAAERKRARGARRSSRRSSARSASSPTAASSRRRLPDVVARRAREARAAPRGAGGAVNREQAERYILARELFGMRFGLDRMRRLMTALDHPERRFDSIHVVGTNGKSSTTRMIAAILEEHGLRTGAYLSPHLVSFGERIRSRTGTSRRRSSRLRSSAPRTRPSWSTARWAATSGSRSSSC